MAKTMKLNIGNVKKITSELAQYMGPDKATEAYIDAEVIGESAFAGFKRLERVKLGPNVKKIEANAFFDCSNIKEVYSIDTCSLSYIGDYAFCGCSSLKCVAFPHTSDFGIAVFEDCSTLESAYIPLCERISKEMFKNCKELKDIDLLNVNYVGPEGFKNAGIEEVYLPKYITLEQEAFAGCYKLKLINLNTEVRSLPFKCFYGCQKLSEVEGGSAVLSLGDDCFGNCSNLCELGLPNVEAYGNRCFEATDFNKFIFNDTAVQLGSLLFLNCPRLDTVVLGCGLEKAQEDSLDGCTCLKNIKINSLISRDISRILHLSSNP